MRVRRVTPQTVRAMLLDGQELALLDLREELTFSQGHLLFARSLPLSRIELRMTSLVPRRSTRVGVRRGEQAGRYRRSPYPARHCDR